MGSPSGRRENDFSMSLSDLGKRDRQFDRCRKLIMSAYKYGDGDPGLAKWIVQEAAGVPRKLHFRVLGRLFYIGFTPTPYTLAQSDEIEAYDSYKPQHEDEGDDSDDDQGGDPVYDKHDHNEAAEVHFTGKKLDGTVFASSTESNTALTFKLIQEDVMPGFTLAIASMQPGEKAIFTIPPEFAVTMSGSSVNIPWDIPKDQTLRFDVELISLINDILDDQGILRKTVKFGSGHHHPRDSDEVFVNYTACLMDGTLVSKSKEVKFILKEGFFCPAFAHAVKTMTEGQEVILIIKPEYGFGESGRPSIGNEDADVPPNATLHVNLKLISWKTVLKYDPNNVEALKLAQAAQTFPEDSVQINAYAMHRGSVSWTSPLNEDSRSIKAEASSMIMKLNQDHKPSGRMIFVAPHQVPVRVRVRVTSQGIQEAPIICGSLPYHDWGGKHGQRTHGTSDADESSCCRCCCCLM